MHYDASQPFRGDRGKAFQLAESALTGLGFRLVSRTAESMDWDGPGMSNSRESALVGASHLRIQEVGRQLAIEAELGGVARMARFVTLFPLGLVLFLGVVLSVTFGALHGPGLWIYIVVAVVGGNGLLWLVLGPLMARGMKTRTQRALDALLANMVAVGEEPR